MSNSAGSRKAIGAARTIASTSRALSTSVSRCSCRCRKFERPWHRAASRAAKTGISPGRELERKMGVLARIGDPEAVGDDVEERDRRERHAGFPIIVADMQYRLVCSGGERGME